MARHTAEPRPHYNLQLLHFSANGLCASSNRLHNAHTAQHQSRARRVIQDAAAGVRDTRSNEQEELILALN